MLNRRQLLKQLGLASASLPLSQLLSSKPVSLKNNADQFNMDKVKDEAFWSAFRQEHYEIADDFINLENGYFGVHPKSVTQAYTQNIQLINRQSSYYMRTRFAEDAARIMEGLAGFAGVSPKELLVTRNATEALNILIQGMAWEKGDEVILSRLDYHSMIETFEMLAVREGLVLRFVDLPLRPRTSAELIQLYESAVTDRTRCILLTHVIHLTGLVLPIRQLADHFRASGIEIIVDAAHSFAQLDFKLPDLGVDFIGVNLHKWFSNPLGAGMLYVKESRISDLKALYGDHRKAPEDIRRLGHFGTPATPIFLTIPEAQAFNEMVTLPLKEARLRYLQSQWTEPASRLDRVQITLPTDQEWRCALASFAIDGMDSQEVVRRLYEDFGVFTVIRYLPDRQVVRVTPNLYNTAQDTNRLLEGIQFLSRQ